MTVGERIKQIREDKNISQEDLSKRLGLKDKSSVCKIEKAGDNVSTKSIVKYAEALGVTPAQIMGWEKEEPDFSEYQVALHSENEYEFVKLFKSANPEIQDAVVTLLKSSKRDS